ncbi:hypothetical protein Hanom_Chr00s214392g01841551 [Helianthus anomalus]
MAGSQWPCVNSCPQPKPPTLTPPYPMSVGFFPIPRVNQYPTQAPPYPTFL